MASQLGGGRVQESIVCLGAIECLEACIRLSAWKSVGETGCVDSVTKAKYDNQI